MVILTMRCRRAAPLVLFLACLSVLFYAAFDEKTTKSPWRRVSERDSNEIPDGDGWPPIKLQHLNLGLQQPNLNLFDSLRDFARNLPSPSTSFFKQLIQNLNHNWQENEFNAMFFKHKLEETTSMSTCDHMMFTQKNTPQFSDIIAVLNGAKIKVTPAIYEMFPKDSLLPKTPFGTCSIVGSSAVLLGSQCGHLIDKADFVFRFNLAPTRGYETDVGRKENMTTMNPSIIRNEFEKLHTSDDVEKFTTMLHDHEGLVWTSAFGLPRIYRDTIKAIQTVSGSNPKLTFVFEDNNHFTAVQAFWKAYGLHKMSSTGFYFVSSALALCKKVNIFGFWSSRISPDGRRQLPYHYFNQIPRKSTHDMSYEFKVILAMHYHGLLHLHVGNCTDDTN